jgi:RHS repeat-associated protein
VNTSNTVVAEYSFDAWGRRRNPLDWGFNLSSQPELFAGIGFTGHEHLPDFNLINMNGRLYDPLVGRFLSPDITVQSPDYTQSYNRYTYCLNNPLKYNDPSGYILPNDFTQPTPDWVIELRENPFHYGSGGGGGGWFEAYKSAISNGYLGGVDNFINQYNNQTSSSDFNGTITVRYQTGSTAYEVEEKWYGVTENGRLFVASTTAPAVTPVYSTVTFRIGSNTGLSAGGDYSNAGFVIDGTLVVATKFLVNEYKRGGDVIEIMKGVKTISKIGKGSTALNIGAVIYDIMSGNVQSSTLTDAAMIVGGGVVGIAIGPITAGIVGMVYGGAMIMGGEDAINNAFNGNWNLQLNKTINTIYGK